MIDEVRPAPLTTTLRDAIEAKLNTLDADAAIVAVDWETSTGIARLAVYGKIGENWSFAGWLAHDTKASNTAVGFEVRRTF